MTGILLVEDDPFLCNLYATTLEGAGHIVSCAGTGRQAQTLLDHNAFDLVVFDLHLADMSSTELLRHIKHRPEMPSVVVMAPYSNINLAMEALREGAQDFISKPFPLARLVVTVNNVMSARHMLSEISRLSQSGEQRAPRWRSWTMKEAQDRRAG